MKCMCVRLVPVGFCCFVIAQMQIQPKASVTAAACSFAQYQIAIESTKKLQFHTFCPLSDKTIYQQAALSHLIWQKPFDVLTFAK